jgi:Putative quorum-sensing-regulated virulence factor
MEIKLTDKSLMPFGKHRGTEMANVPASYLMWLFEGWEETPPKTAEAKQVLEYVEANKDLLERERQMADYPKLSECKVTGSTWCVCPKERKVFENDTLILAPRCPDCGAYLVWGIPTKEGAEEIRDKIVEGVKTA